MNKKRHINGKKTTEEFIAQVKEHVGDEYSVLGQYAGSKIAIAIKHNTCESEYKVRPTTFLQGRRCKSCFEVARTKTTIHFIEEVKKLTGDEFSVLSEYQNNKTKLSMRHNVCESEYEVSPDSFLMGSRCPKCKYSKGEKAVAEVLERFSLRFETEFTFENCRNKRTLPFDFVVFVKDTENKVAIEFDGELHYVAVKHFGGEYALNHRQMLDSIKTKFCEENDIPLIRIPYWKIDEIEEILTRELLPLTHKKSH